MKQTFVIVMAAMIVAAIALPQPTMAEHSEVTTYAEPSLDAENSYVEYSAFYSGKVGKSLGITMYLEHHSEGVYHGWYYYNKYGPSNKLTINGYRRNGRIYLEEYSPDNQNTGCFEGIFNDYGVFVGTLLVYKNGKEYSVTLYPQH